MTTRVGIVGSGYISRGLIAGLQAAPDMDVSCVLTRSHVASRPDFPYAPLLTTSLDRLLNDCDVVVECSGSVVHATVVIDAALGAGIPVVTMNAEMQVTTGSYFVGRGVLTEAEGDQPGCLAALAHEAVAMGFKPLVYGNVKGFLNENPPPEDMEYWAARQGISLDKCIAFTDGTKVQIEQALVANGLGATIAIDGLVGQRSEDLEAAAHQLASIADERCQAVSDFVVCPKAPPGVFVVGTHQPQQRPYLRNFKLGEGPYYMLLRNYHLCHLEIPKTIRVVLEGGAPLLHNTQSPSVGVAAIAKRTISSGYTFARGIGSYDTRGIGVSLTKNPNHVPIGLLEGAIARRTIAAGQMLTVDDVDTPDSLAAEAWRAVLTRTMG